MSDDALHKWRAKVAATLASGAAPEQVVAALAKRGLDHATAQSLVDDAIRAQAGRPQAGSQASPGHAPPAPEAPPPSAPPPSAPPPSAPPSPPPTVSAAEPVVAPVSGQAAQPASLPPFLLPLIEQGRSMLEGGQSMIDLFQHCHAQCAQAYATAPAQSLFVARMLVESMGAVFNAHLASPLDANDFLQAVANDQALLQTGLPIGQSGALYPTALPSRFFHNPHGFFEESQAYGDQLLRHLWETTPGCGASTSGLAHQGSLHDGRRYVVLRLPPPQFRMEAHFVACVAASEASIARMFAMERGGSSEETLLVEHYIDGRLRLGAAGPAESQNFIRLVRQQLSL